MTLRELPNPFAALRAGEPMPSGLAELLAQAERDGQIVGLRIGRLQGLKTGLLLGVCLTAAVMVAVQCGSGS